MNQFTESVVEEAASTDSKHFDLQCCIDRNSLPDNLAPGGRPLRDRTSFENRPQGKLVMSIAYVRTMRYLSRVFLELNDRDDRAQ